jgi:hypothetical protein
MRKITVSKFGTAWMDNADVNIVLEVEAADERGNGYPDYAVQIEVPHDEAIRLADGLHEALTSGEPAPTHEEIVASLERKPRYEREQHGGG